MWLFAVLWALLKITTDRLQSYWCPFRRIPLANNWLPKPLYLSVLHVVVRRECAAFESFLPVQRRENRVAIAWAVCRMFEHVAFKWFWLRWAFEGFNNDGLYWLCQYVIRSTETGVSWCPDGPVWPDSPPGTTSSSSAFKPILLTQSTVYCWHSFAQVAVCLSGPNV